ncbi:MAG: hypothetical protein HS120_02205 [Burkholderiales bacterium]|nr:hypothetical protein [Burkholderiales bacterium]
MTAKAVARLARAFQRWHQWHRTFVRFSCWREKGVWERVATALQGDADMEHLFIDSTIVRAHQHSAGAQKRPTGNWPFTSLID